MTRLLTDWRLWLTTAFLLLVILLGAVVAGNADRADRALDQTDAALAEVERVRADAVSDRRAMRERIDQLLADIDGMRSETRLLRAQVEALQTQVRDLGGEPEPPPPSAGAPQEQGAPPPADDRPAPEPPPAEPAPEPEPDPLGDLIDELLPDLPASHPSDQQGRPDHAGRQGPPDHARPGGRP